MKNLFIYRYLLVLWNKEILRFIVVGFFNTLFSYGMYAIFLFIGFGYVIANFIALFLGILFSFKTQAKFVFCRNENQLIFRFFLGWLFIYLFTITVITLLLLFGFDEYIAGALALPFSTAFSYLVQKRIVFRHFGNISYKVNK